MIDNLRVWLDATGLPTDSPAELLIALAGLGVAGWLLLHLLLDD